MTCNHCGEPSKSALCECCQHPLDVAGKVRFTEERTYGTVRIPATDVWVPVYKGRHDADAGVVRHDYHGDYTPIDS